MKFAGWTSLLIGVVMLSQWAFFIAAGQVPELRTEPIRIVFHLAGEAATAFALIASGILLLRGVRWAPKLGLIAYGMLIYTVIVSPGYFAQRGQWPLVAMFGVVLLLALAVIAQLVREERAG
ncbi:MAG: hypothetical protein C4521_12170 [Actinobacteria bacterium]|nr:MAG: hypothetical protein C4521_12170 [Actinomycetota bacterium]